MATTPRRDILQRIDTADDLLRALSAWDMYHTLDTPQNLGTIGADLWRLAHACATYSTTLDEPSQRILWRGLPAHTIRSFRHDHAEQNPSLEEC